MALARSFVSLGHRVICCANLPNGECRHAEIEFWNFGAEYEIHRIAERLSTIGPFHCLAATLVHPFLFLRQMPNCLSRIVINHSPSAMASGLEPVTVMTLIDCMVAVSQAQRSLLLIRGTDPEKVVVVKNGFDPDIFGYSGPEGRDFQELIFIGRIEAPKGIHILVDVFARLKAEFPQLKLSVFGDESYWPEFILQKPALERQLPGLRFRGKVPQSELASHLRRAGLLVFPSISFESAGLAVVDAQASGCPAVGFAVGGVPEYLLDGSCGRVVREISAEALHRTLAELLRTPEKLRDMSRNCESLGRKHSWSRAAAEILAIAENAHSRRKPSSAAAAEDQSLIRTRAFQGVDPQQLLQDHERIMNGVAASDDEIARRAADHGSKAAALLWRGLRQESQKRYREAADIYREAVRFAAADDWQPFFRLALLHAESSELRPAADAAAEVLARCPQFFLRDKLEQLIALSKAMR